MASYGRDSKGTHPSPGRLTGLQRSLRDIFGRGIGNFFFVVYSLLNYFNFQVNILILQSGY